MRVWCVLSMLVVFVFSAPLALAQESQRAPGARDHEGGFFLRLSGGVGSAQSSIDVPGTKVKLSGASADINFAIGAMVSPNLAVHGTAFGWLVSDPSVDVNGADAGTASSDLDMSALGGGITYYVMPANVYLSASVGVGSLTAKGSDLSGETDTGIAAEGTVGKEWWVGDKWGLGVAGAVGFHSFGDKDVDQSWSGVSFALRFSATMN